MGRTRFRTLQDYVEHRLDTEPRLTHEQIAADLDISPSSLSLYLSRKRRPGADAALRIAERAGVPIESLLEATTA
jgi:transcriptional regulator with XRE-family HTH domain